MKTYTGPAAPSPPAPSAPSRPALATAPVGGSDAASGNAKSSPAELVFIFPPNDVENGDAEGNIYRNEFLGLSYKFPRAWAAAEPEVLDQLNHVRSQQMQSSGVAGAEEPAGPDGYVHVPFPQIIFQASPDQGRRIPAVSIMVSQTSASAVESARKEAERLKQQGTSVLVAPHEVTIGKREFFRTDFATTQDDPPAWTATIETSVGQHYVVALEIRARSKQELDGLAATAETLLIVEAIAQLTAEHLVAKTLIKKDRGRD